MLIDIVKFFSDYVFQDLQAEQGYVHPILWFDVIRFLCTFRNQLTKSQFPSVIPLLVRYLGSSSYVTYTYAAITIDRVLSIKQNNIFMQTDIREFAPELISTLLTKGQGEDGGGCTHSVGWNTKISAQESNYGTRIDYILATHGLRPWIMAADIQPDIKGCDPTPDGHILTLRDAMGYAPGREPPRLAAQHWDEHSGKQLLLDRFFGRASKSGLAVPRAGITPVVVVETVGDSQKHSGCFAASDACTGNHRSDPPGQICDGTNTKKNPMPQVAPDKRAGQSKLSSFAKPQASQGSTPTSDKSKSKSTPTIIIDDDNSNTEPPAVDEEADYRLALALSQEFMPTPTVDAGESIKAWGRLLAPLQPPRSTAHGGSAKEMTVNKPGSNRGKHFFICAW
ncbi:Cse1-domain-containing protein [Infundibulicybe gibba]|nr:Cse1-domain-containing protein [Infundibulicybe gibba]